MFGNDGPANSQYRPGTGPGRASGVIGYSPPADTLVAWPARRAAIQPGAGSAARGYRGIVPLGPHMHARERHNVAGTPAVEGIINPPIDDLLEVVDSKYGLVIMASKRARQINAYYAQLSEGLLEYVGPLVETRVQEKPLSIALREISEGLVSAEEAES
jgi:DNA-directed RNA polymerase subunit omega